MIMFKNSNNSLIHTLNPFIKLLLTIIFIISCFIATSPEAIFFLSLFLLILILSSNAAMKDYLKYWWLVIIVFAIVLIFDLIIKFTFAPFTGIVKSILIISIILLFAFTTKSSEITMAFEIFLYPLKLFKVNTHKIAVLITLYLNFIPIFMKEYDKVIKSKNNRQIKRNVKEWLLDKKIIIKQVIKKTVNQINNKIDLIKIKNYDFDNQTKYNYNLKAEEMDYILVGMQLLLFIAIIVKR